MDNFKDFQGKDLDECIEKAREYFNAPREKLEIEFIQDAKSGIFGIVGARKAKIRARRARLPGTPEESESPPEQTRDKTPDDMPSECGEPKDTAAPIPAEAQTPEPKDEESGAFDTTELDEFPRENRDALYAGLDKEQLEKLTLEVATRLINPVAGKETPIKLNIDNGLLIIKVAWEGDAGLLIGRDGQTLAAIQYLIARIVSKIMNAPFRARVDIGDYRARQEDKLRAMAKALADKARQNGRSYATRPLSSYHRRIIHLCLQNDPDVQTRSAGEGALKRVLVTPRRLAGRS